MYGASLAFKEFSPLDGIWGSPWIGLKNFETLFQMNDFWTVTRNTVIINIMYICIGFPAPVIFALLLNELRVKVFKRFVQTITYLPYFISWVVIGGLLLDFLSPTRGLINVVLKLLGFEEVFFMIRPDYFRWILVLSSIWKNLGFNAILYLAALSNIDPQLYEASSMDGAKKMRQLWHITLPGISSTVVLLFILSIGSIMNSNFEQTFVLYNPSVYETGDLISTYIYRIGLLGAQFSLTTALGLFNSIINFTLLIFANRMARKYSEYAIW